MAMPLHEVEATALELSLRERAQLITRLVQSLDDPATDDPTRVGSAWGDAIRRRIAEIDAGTVESIPAERVFADLRARKRA
jgi:putative addiction module component (TIGR02574 family)